MKWEILKGSEKDFEGAPGWSMVVLYNNIACGKVFAEGLKIGRKRTSLIGCVDTVIVAEHEWDVIAERRPITEPDVNQQVTTEWDGEGLPPVGVKCEMLWNNEWAKCVVKAYGDEQFIFKADGHREWAGHINNFSFRPIRSPEDIARARSRSEECDKIFGIISDVPRQGNRSDMAEAIYDAGYRKVE